MTLETAQVPLRPVTRLCAICPLQSSAINRWSGSVRCENTQRNQVFPQNTQATHTRTATGPLPVPRLLTISILYIPLLITQHKMVCPCVVGSVTFRAVSTVCANERGRHKACRGEYQAEETLRRSIYTLTPVILSGMFPTFQFWRRYFADTFWSGVKQGRKVITRGHRSPARKSEQSKRETLNNRH